ncbi:hypothetical protein BYT27DRAFT_6514200 [Phlegmacium glaucopus]|nr:hypothetical protein BYT27DRAFT_6514200 [Phlegmacium glaucopus]
MTGGGKDEGMETRKDSSLNWGGRDSSEGSFIYIFLFVCFVHNLLTVYITGQMTRHSFPSRSPKGECYQFWDVCVQTRV